MGVIEVLKRLIDTHPSLTGDDKASLHEQLEEPAAPSPEPDPTVPDPADPSAA